MAKAEEEQTESVESESFADTDEQITINEVSELTTIAIDVGNKDVPSVPEIRE